MIEKLIEAESKLNFIPKNDYHLFFSLNAWKKFRDAGISIAQWSDKELSNRNKKTGLIGVKQGIECYVLANFR